MEKDDTIFEQQIYFLEASCFVQASPCRRQLTVIRRNEGQLQSYWALCGDSFIFFSKCICRYLVRVVLSSKEGFSRPYTEQLANSEVCCKTISSAFSDRQLRINITDHNRFIILSVAANRQNECQKAFNLRN